MYNMSHISKKGILNVAHSKLCESEYLTYWIIEHVSNVKTLVGMFDMSFIDLSILHILNIVNISTI